MATAMATDSRAAIVTTAAIHATPIIATTPIVTTPMDTIRTALTAPHAVARASTATHPADQAGAALATQRSVNGTMTATSSLVRTWFRTMATQLIHNTSLSDTTTGNHMNRILFAIIAAVLAVAVSAPALAGDAFLYNRDTNRFIVQGQTYTATPVKSATTYQEDRYGVSYSARATYANGQTYAYGYSLPKAYTWQCYGTGCSKTPYMNGMRYNAAHPVLSNNPRAYTYGYVSTRTYW